MEFSQYTWSLYKQFSGGQKVINEFEEACENMSVIDLLYRYNPTISNEFNREKLLDIFETLWAYKKNACENAGESVANHFADIRKMVPIGLDSEREIDDYMLTRYACYLIVQTGDSLEYKSHLPKNNKTNC